MATQSGNSVAPPSPREIGIAFVLQYYDFLVRSPENVYKFYHDESFLGRPDSNGTMTCVTTMHAINKQILSTDFTGCLIKLENVVTQSSHKDGVLILVTGSLSGPDTVKHRFTQSFFLAPQESGGYFVMNDVLRYISERPSTEINEALDSHVNENTLIATFPVEPETTSVKVGVDPELPSAEKISINDKVINPPAIDNSPQENNVGVETCVKVVSEDAEKIPEAAPAPASAQKDVTKKPYASIPKPKPKPTVNGDEKVDKSATLPVKPVLAADSTRGHMILQDVISSSQQSCAKTKGKRKASYPSTQAIRSCTGVGILYSGKTGTAIQNPGMPNQMIIITSASAKVNITNGGYPTMNLDATVPCARAKSPVNIQVTCGSASGVAKAYALLCQRKKLTASKMKKSCSSKLAKLLDIPTK